MAHLRVAAAGVAAAAALTATFVVLGVDPGSRNSDPAPRVAALRHAQPLAFEPNAGRFRGAGDYLVHDQRATVAIGATRSVLAVGKRGALTTSLLGASPAHAHAARRLAGVINWYAGPRKVWRTGLPTFDGVRYPGVYRGVDVSYHGRRGRLEYDFALAPHASPAQIALRLTGASSLHVAANGGLVARVAGHTVRQLRPVAYQQVAGARRTVRAGFVLHGDRLGFELGRYDHTRRLVIDPVMTYGDYFGGTGSDAANDVAVDSAHDMIIGGSSSSSSIAGVSGGAPSGAGLVAKIGPDGTRQWATFLGWGVNGVAVDGGGNVLIAGYTNQASFTPTGGAQQATYGGAANDAFAAKLSPAGSMSWGTYLGGSSTEVAEGVAVDGSGAAYVVGYSNSTNGIATAGTMQTSNNGSSDGFLVKYSSSGARQFGTYMGGSSYDEASAVAIAPGCQSSCPAFAGGYSWGGFPTTSGTDRQTHSSNYQDGFVIRVSPTGGDSWASYTPHDPISGPSVDGSSSVKGIAVSPAGNPTVVGGAGQSSGTAAFISTFIAGSGKRGPEPGDQVFPSTDDGSFHDVAYDAQGNAYAIGQTGSTNLSTTSAVQPASGGGAVDAFAMKFIPSRSAALPAWSTYLGGNDDDYGYGIATDTDGGAVLAGYTDSANFPTANARYGPSTPSDAFVVRLDVATPSIQSGPSGTIFTGSATFTYGAGDQGATYSCKLTPVDADFSPCPASGKTYSALADGAYTFAVRSVDIGGTPSHSVTQGFTVDTTPHALFTIAPNPVLAGRSATFDASASTGGGQPITKYEWDLDGDGKFERDTGSIAKTGEAFAKAGTIPVSLRVTTASGATGIATQDLHVSAATGATQFGVTINNGAQYTRTPNVTVNAVFPAGTSSLLFSNDGGFLQPLNFPAEKSTKWKLDSSGPERLPKIVYVRFLNSGIVSETHTDDIILDETPPKVDQAAVAPAAATSSAATASAAKVKLRRWKVKVKAHDSNSGVSKIEVTSNKKRPGRALKYKRKLTVKSAKRPRFIRARDRAGNWSRWKKAR